MNDNFIYDTDYDYDNNYNEESPQRKYCIDYSVYEDYYIQLTQPNITGNQYDELAKLTERIEFEEYPFFGGGNPFANTLHGQIVPLLVITGSLLLLTPDNFPYEYYMDITYTLNYSAWRNPYIALSMKRLYWRFISVWMIDAVNTRKLYSLEIPDIVKQLITRYVISGDFLCAYDLYYDAMIQSSTPNLYENELVSEDSDIYEI